MRTFDLTCKLVCSAGALLLTALVPTTATADGMLYGEPIGTRPALMVTDWSGFYIGGQLGGAWGDVDWTQGNANYFNTVGAAIVGSESSFEASGFTGGILGGFNIQSENWVFGIELAFNGVGISETKASPFFPAMDTYKSEVDFITTITGRVATPGISGSSSCAAAGRALKRSRHLLPQPTASLPPKTSSWMVGPSALVSRSWPGPTSASA